MIVLTRYLLFIVLLIQVWGGCSADRERCAFVPDTANIQISLEWESLEDSLPAITTKKQLVSMLSRYPVLRDEFLGRRAYPDDSTFVNDRFQRFTNPHIDTLLSETHNVFGDASELKEQFRNAFANMKFYYPGFEVPRIQTTISGLERDLFVSDSLIIVGLDYFMGPGRKYELTDVYDYIKRRYHKDFIVPSVTLLYGISGAINKYDPADRSMLAEMITYGKAYHFAKLMNPCVPDSVIIGYSKDEMEGSREYESLIWSRLVEDQVLFSTSNQDKQKYIAERPKTLEVGERCPGRIGQWIGWRIVEMYHRKNPDVALSTVMEMTDARKLFENSGYKPQIVKLPPKKKI
jgi:hypothetical protein